MPFTPSFLLVLTLLSAQAPAEPPALVPLPAPAETAPAPAGAATTSAVEHEGAAAPELLTEPAVSPAPELFTPQELTPLPTSMAPAEPEKGTNAQPNAAAAKPRLLVLDLVDQGAGPLVVGGLSQAMQAQAVQSYPGDVVTTAQLRVALDAAGLQALSGCMSEACMTNLAGTVEAERALGGSLGKAGDDYVITLLLVDSKTGARVRQEQRKVPAHQDLSYYAVKELTALVLTGKSASPLVPVVISASEPGALVIVDGQQVGAAPVTTQLDPGRHEVRVEKDGFVTWKTVADVQEATPLELHAALTDPGFPLWPFAVSAGVVSLAAVAGGAWFGVAAQNSYDGSLPLGKPADSYLGRPNPDTAFLLDKKQSVREQALWADVLYGTGAVLGVAALGLFTWELGAAAMSE